MENTSSELVCHLVCSMCVGRDHKISSLQLSTPTLLYFVSASPAVQAAVTNTATLYRPEFATAGAGAVKGNLRALNQSVSSQVATLMKDPTKLARRAGISTEQRPRVLCQAAEPLAEPAVNPMGKQAAAAGLLENGSVNGASSAREEELDLEAFDDGEFYAQLLKEFLDSSGGSAGATGPALYPQVNPYTSD